MIATGAVDNLSRTSIGLTEYGKAIVFGPFLLATNDSKSFEMIAVNEFSAAGVEAFQWVVFDVQLSAQNKRVS